jgi:hypothetical protein
MILPSAKPLPRPNAKSFASGDHPNPHRGFERVRILGRIVQERGLDISYAANKSTGKLTADHPSVEGIESGHLIRRLFLILQIERSVPM